MSSQHTEFDYWATCTSFPKFGSVRLRRLHDHFGSMELLWNASHSQLQAARISDGLVNEFIEHRKIVDISRASDVLRKQDIRLVRFFDDEFPELLSHIFDPPAVLFVRGFLNPKMEMPIAVVGSRKMTHYGEQIIDTIIPSLVKSNCSIISGLALGADGRAHEQTLKSSGYTVAVLGSGNDDAHLYPRQHAQLARRIIDSGGAVISEFPPHTPPLKHHFPLRNRIISGLSRGTFVVEAAEKSGSLITARVALEQNREVFASPGSVFSHTSIGCNQLIAMGAHCVTSAKNILDVFQIDTEEQTSISYTPNSPDEAVILSVLSHEAMHIDDCIVKAELPAARVMTLLTMLETKRIVKQISGMRYVKISNS
ncbi:MAG: DNA-protecting protein DprA [Parcubacteria group bacterium]|nr:DNA-protecting protein DprA [Parcubacteria group bacterium]